MYLEWECEACGFEFNTIQSDEVDYAANLECVECRRVSVVKSSVELIGLPLKED